MSWNLKIIALLFALVSAVKMFGTTSPTPNEHLMALRLVKENVLILYYAMPETQAFPEEPKNGNVGKYAFAPGVHFKLLGVSLPSRTESGEEAYVFVTWGLKPTLYSPAVPWIELASRFAEELVKIYTPKTPDERFAKANGAPIVPGSFEASLSNDDIRKLGNVSSIIYAISPNGVTMAAATVVGGLLIIDNSMGKSGMTIGYNPFIGVNYVMPRKWDDESKKAVADLMGMVGTNFETGRFVAQQAAAGRADATTGALILLPQSILMPPKVIECVKDAVQNPGKTVNKTINTIVTGGGTWRFR